jgi:hypothetical protein
MARFNTEAVNQRTDNVVTKRTNTQVFQIVPVKPVLRGHLWDKEKNGLIRQVTS